MENVSNIDLQAKFCKMPHVSGQCHEKCHYHVPYMSPTFWELLGCRIAEIGTIPIDTREEMSSKSALHKQKKKKTKVFQIELEIQFIKILEVASALQLSLQHFDMLHIKLQRGICQFFCGI